MVAGTGMLDRPGVAVDERAKGADHLEDKHRESGAKRFSIGRSCRRPYAPRWLGMRDSDADEFVSVLMEGNAAIPNRRIGKLRAKKETVTQPLTEFIQRRKQRDILKALGTIEFREEWDYNKDRRDREPRR